MKWNWFIKLNIPIFFTDYTYFSILLGILWFILSLYKFFYILEIKKEYEEIERIKNNYLKNWTYINFKKLFNLDNKTLFKKYENDTNKKYILDEITKWRNKDIDLR